MQSANFSDMLEGAIERHSAAGETLQEAARYHLSKTGKRNRARLLKSLASQEVPQSAVVAAGAACELLHEASIVHDDLQDNESTRRGQLPVWQVYGEDAALLLGDHLIASAFRAALDGALAAPASRQLTALLVGAISQAAEGQHRQLVTGLDSPDLRGTYEKICFGKTGALLALPMQCAGVLRGLSPLQIEALGNCGQLLGLAYQILDDLESLHDAACADVRQGLLTAPVVEAAAMASGLDPLQLLMAGGLPAEQVRQRCRFWLARVTGTALEQASRLPADMLNAIRTFVEGGLQAPAEAIAPLAGVPQYLVAAQ